MCVCFIVCIFICILFLFVLEAKTLMHPEGEWNTFRIQAKGSKFTCWINGKQASEYTDEKFSGAGPVGIQIHGGVVMKCEYRNMRIAPL